MSRPRTFTPSTVVEAAKEPFWKRATPAVRIDAEEGAALCDSVRAEVRSW
jgi:hypothetical protein